MMKRILFSKKKCLLFMLTLMLAAALTGQYNLYAADKVRNEIYSDAFIDNRINPNAIFRYSSPNYRKIEENRLYLGFSTANNDWINSAEAYTVTQSINFDEIISAYEYHVTFKSSGLSANLGCACMVGIRTGGIDKDSYNPQKVNSGLYIALADNSKARIFHGKEEDNNFKGAFDIDTPGNFEETNTLVIRDMNGVVSYYMNTGSQNRVLFLTIDMTGDTLYAYDADGNEVYRSGNNLKGQEGYFKIFNRNAATIVDKISIFGITESNPATLDQNNGIIITVLFIGTGMFLFLKKIKLKY